MPISDGKDTFAPRPPQADQGSQDLSSRKPQQRGFCWFWSMSREICQQRGKHLLDSCVVASSPNFSLFLTSLGGRLQCCMMKREIPNKSDLHSATVMICVDWPHSARCRKISFSRDLASKQGLGLSDPHLPPQAAQSPEIRFAGTSSSSSSVAVGSREQARGQVQGLATSRRVRSAPAGKLVQYNQHLGN